MGQMLRPWKTILELELDAPKAVFQQIADGIIEEIQKGRLLPGTPLPGSRELAADIGVNRKTVVLAYEELLAEGWLSSVPKKGTFVSEKLPNPKRTAPAGPVPAVASTFSYNVFTDTKPIIPVQAKAPIVFGDGMPDVKLAPLDELARAYRRVFGQKARWKLMGYGNAKGEERLLTALSQLLRSDRGMRTDAENICVTRGSQMALYLTAHTLIKPGDTVAVEDPGYDAVWQSFRHAGAVLEPVPVDEQGICTTALEKLCKRKPVKAVYVTPHHQYPTAVTMKAGRRMHLVNLSNQYKFAIVEDDYDHDYHFGQRSLLPLASCGQAANVIYISTLSKLVAPAIRLGYVAGPKEFIDSLANLRKLIDRQGDAVMEQAVAELLEEGEIRKHARRALNVYRERQEAMATYLRRYLGDQVTFQQPEGGLAFWITFTQPTDVKVLAEALLKKGVKIASCGAYSFHGKPLNAVRLGYATLTIPELEEGIRIMRDVLATLHEPVLRAVAEPVC
jgi:GntR family transcriptional regulator/MocR family aminotransferase